MNQKDKVERLAEYGARCEARLLARIAQLEQYARKMQLENVALREALDQKAREALEES